MRLLTSTSNWFKKDWWIKLWKNLNKKPMQDEGVVLPGENPKNEAQQEQVNEQINEHATVEETAPVAETETLKETAETSVELDTAVATATPETFIKKVEEEVHKGEQFVEKEWHDLTGTAKKAVDTVEESAPVTALEGLVKNIESHSDVLTQAKQELIDLVTKLDSTKLPAMAETAVKDIEGLLGNANNKLSNVSSIAGDILSLVGVLKVLI